ncbi:hypothetical protein CEXT_416301 [Caerostris extrusa]|uniref:Uncharacterized protein n=1 Tax=Caerostris extrusa TaxID=172846 RepID=A0AAV4XHY4_CAEEX|nr:hypothetical protein CEXT_416301 [Caerostris extrusa]
MALLCKKLASLRKFIKIEVLKIKNNLDLKKRRKDTLKYNLSSRIKQNTSRKNKKKKKGKVADGLFSKEEHLSSRDFGLRQGGSCSRTEASRVYTERSLKGFSEAVTVNFGELQIKRRINFTLGDLSSHNPYHARHPMVGFLVWSSTMWL